MVTAHEVDSQLKKIGASFRYFGRREKNELRNILMPGEQITACINGRYEGGFAMLAATDQRLLLIDKKLMFLTVEDIRYDMIAEIDYSYRVMEATVNVRTPMRNLSFISFKQSNLRKLVGHVQQRVMELRQQAMPQTMNLITNPVADSTPQAAKVEPTSKGALDEVRLQYEQPQATGLINPVKAIHAVRNLPKRINNPYTKMPLMMRRRVSRYYQ